MVYMYLIFCFNLLHVRLVLFNLLFILFHFSFKPLVLKQQTNKQTFLNSLYGLRLWMYYVCVASMT